MHPNFSSSFYLSRPCSIHQSKNFPVVRKKRLYLLKVLAAAPNVLLLDEITNDIDIPTLTILEDYLDSFAGIVIAVSHDRYFLDNLADRIFEFDREGNLTQYEGGYTDYLEAKKRRKV